jgi:hypothetical protein
MELLAIFVILVTFDYVALRWGFDSRDHVRRSL